MVTGYWLPLQPHRAIDGLCLPVPICYGLDEIALLRARLSKLGVDTMLRSAQNRSRGKMVLLVTRSDLPNLDKLVGHLLIPSKAHLTKAPLKNIHVCPTL